MGFGFVMGIIEKCKKDLSVLLSDFEGAEKNENLHIGVLDERLKELIRGIISGMIIYYENDDIYFGLVDVLNNMVDFLKLDRDWMIWSKVTFDYLNGIELGSKMEIFELEKTRDSYL